MSRFANDEAGRAFVAVLTDAFNTLRDNAKTALTAQESLTATVRALDSVFAAMPLPFDDALREKAAAAHRSQIALLTAIAGNTGVAEALDAQKKAQQAFTFAAERATRPDADAQRNGAELTFFFEAMFGTSETVRQDIALAAKEGNLDALFEYTSKLYAPTEEPVDVPAPPQVAVPLLDVESAVDKQSSNAEKAIRDAVMRKMERVPNLRAQDLTGSVVAAAARIREHPDFVLSQVNPRIADAIVPFVQKIGSIPGELYTLAMTRVFSWINPFAWYRQYTFEVDYYQARVSELANRRDDINNLKTLAQQVAEMREQLNEDIREASWDVGYLAPRRPNHHLRGVHTAAATKSRLERMLADEGAIPDLTARQNATVVEYKRLNTQEEANLKSRIAVLRHGGAALKDDDAVEAAMSEWQERLYETDQEAFERIQRMFPGAVLSLVDGQLVAAPNMRYIPPTQGQLPAFPSIDNTRDSDQLPSVRVLFDRAIDGDTDLWTQGFKGTLSPSTVQLFFESPAFTSSDLVARFPLLWRYVNSVKRLNRASPYGFAEKDDTVVDFATAVDEALINSNLPLMGGLVRSLKEYAFARVSSDDNPFTEASQINDVLEEVPPPEDSTHQTVLRAIKVVTKQFNAYALQSAFRLGHVLSVLNTQEGSLRRPIAIEIAPGRELTVQERLNVEQALQESVLTVFAAANEQSRLLVEAPVAEANRALGYSHSLSGPTTIDIVQRAPGKLFGFPEGSLIEIELQTPTVAQPESKAALDRIIERSPLRPIRTLTRMETANRSGGRPRLVVDEIIRNVLPEELRRIQVANVQTGKVVTIRVSNDSTATPQIIERSFPADITAGAEPNGSLLMSRLHAAMLGTMAGRTFVQSVTALLTEARQPQGTFLRDDEQTFIELLRSYTINPLQNLGDLLVSMARSRDSSHEALLALTVVSSGIGYLLSLYGIVRVCIWPLIALVDRLTGVVSAAMRVMLQSALLTVRVVSANTQWALVTSMLNTFEQASRRHTRGGAVKREVELLRRYAATMIEQHQSPLDVAPDPNFTFLEHLKRFADEYALVSIGARAAYTTLFAALTESFKTYRWLQAAATAGILAAVTADIYSTGALLGAINILVGLLVNVTLAAWAAPRTFFLTFAYGAITRYTTRTVALAVAQQISRAVSKLGGGDAYDPKSVAAAVRRGVVAAAMLLGNLAPYVVGSEYTVVPDDAGIIQAVNAGIGNMIRTVFTEGVTIQPMRVTSDVASQLLPVYTGRLLGRLSADLTWYLWAQHEFGAYVAPSNAAEQKLMADVADAFSPAYLRQTGNSIAIEGKLLWQRIIERLIEYDTTTDEARLLEQRRGALLPQSLALATNVLLLLTNGGLSIVLQQQVASLGPVVRVAADFAVKVRAPTAEQAAERVTRRYAEVVRDIPALRGTDDDDEATTEQIVETKEYEGERRFSIQTSNNPSPTQMLQFGSRQLEALLNMRDVRLLDIRVKYAHNKLLRDPNESLLDGMFKWLDTPPIKYIELLRGIDIDALTQELFVTLAVGERSPLVSTAK